MTRRSIVWIVATTIVSVAVIVVTRLLLDKDLWEGLGQWVGGVGALFAAGVALWVSHQETRHRQDAEFEAAYADAHFVTSGWRPESFDEVRPFVRNNGARPVTHVRAVALHPLGDPSQPVVKIDPPGRPVLLPQLEWSAPSWQLAAGEGQGETLSLRADVEAYDIEIEFQDLAGNTWRRIGENPPTCKSRAKS